MTSFKSSPVMTLKRMRCGVASRAYRKDGMESPSRTHRAKPIKDSRAGSDGAMKYMNVAVVQPTRTAFETGQIAANRALIFK